MCFFCPFNILITLLWEEGAGLCAYRALLFISYAHVNLCHFSLPSGVRGWLRLLLVALPGLFCLPFSTILQRGHLQLTLMLWRPKSTSE